MYFYNVGGYKTQSSFGLGDDNLTILKNMDELEEYISQPSVVQEKGSVDRIVNYAMRPKMEINGKKIRPLDKSYAVLMTSIIIDIDDSITIEEAKQYFEGVTYGLYTTHSHGKGDSDRFRIILPLAKSDYIPKSVWDSVGFKPAFIEEFPFADANAVSFRAMLTPAISSDDAEYHYHVNRANLYSPAALKHTTERHIEDYKAKCMARQMEYATKKRLGLIKDERKFEGNGSCSDSHAVNDYMCQSYPMMSGNGDSDLNLYKAIVKCVKNKDISTMDMISQKAFAEGWTTREVNHKVEYAETYWATQGV